MTIVGVNGAEFKGAKAGGTAELFFPLALQQQVIPNPKGSLLAQNGYWWLVILGRLKPGVSIPEAQADMTVLNQWRIQQLARTNRDPLNRQLKTEVQSASTGASTERMRG